jgi:uncharacterized membrane protein HdeD (DUF308 family)
MQGSKRFIDWVNLLLGIWLIISPWVLGIVASTAATVVLVVMGAAIGIFSIWALVRLEDRAAEWWNFFLGVLLFVLPWIFRYTSTYSGAWNSWIVGFVVAVLSLITMSLINGMHRKEREHHA